MAVQLLDKTLVMKPRRSHHVKPVRVEEVVDETIENVYGEPKADKFDEIIDLLKQGNIYGEKKEITLSGAKAEFNLKNLNMGPKIEKVVLNMGLGLDGNDSKIIKSCEEDMAKITGQKPVITKFKKSVANFKTRKGSNAGLKVTLRKNKMYEFLDRLVNIALPRVKDFRGLSVKGFDQFGNYTFGIKEHIIFPEVSFDRADKVRGLDVVIVISTLNKDHSYALLKKMNFPFIQKGEN